MEKRYRHIPTKATASYDEVMNCYLDDKTALCIPKEFVENGSDWEEIKEPEKINVGLTSAGNLPSDQKVMFIVGGHFETQNISQFSSLLNGESFTREDMILDLIKKTYGYYMSCGRTETETYPDFLRDWMRVNPL